MTTFNEDAAIVSASKVFVAANPGFRRDAKIADEMIDFMLEHNLPQTDVESWQKAYDQVCRDSVTYNAGGFHKDGTARVYIDAEAIDAMPADVMKKRLKDPIFSRGVNLVLGEEK